MPSLTAPPSATDSNDFSSRGDSFHTDLVTFNLAAKQESTDALQVLLGEASYSSLLPFYTASSVTSNTVGYGNLSFTVSTNKLFVSDMRIRAVNGVNWASGTVTSYNASTGALVMKVLAFSGSGTYTSWTIQPEFRRVPGALTTVASAATVNLSYAGDRAINLTGPIPITAITLTKGQVVYLIAQDVITLTHNPASLKLPASKDYTTNVGDVLQVCETGGAVSIAVYPKSGLKVAGNTLRAIFGFGFSTADTSTTNIVSSLGVMAADITGVGTVRESLAAVGYGGDKAIFGYGSSVAMSRVSMTNLVSNLGVVATDTTGVGTARYGLAAAGYGGNKALFGYGVTGSYVAMTNLVGSTGVVAADVTGIGTSRYYPGAACYGITKAIFGYGNGAAAYVSVTNLVTDLGVVSVDTTGVGTARYGLAAVRYGVDTAIFGYGSNGSDLNMSNLVSNLGIVSADATGVGTGRRAVAAASYGEDKAIFGYGTNGSSLNISNLVANTGNVTLDVTFVGTAKSSTAAAGFSQ